MSEVLNVHAYDWIVKDQDGDDDQTVIDCWALDVESVPCLLRIVDFPVFCMIELPSTIRNKEHKWTLAQSKNVMITINKLLGHNASIKSEFFYCQKLYYYQGSRKSPFIRAYFRNIREMNSCKYKLENTIYTEDWGCIKCTVYENQINVVRKLLTLRNIRFSKWFEVVGVKVLDELKISTLENEYIINWQSMMPIADEICGNWITNPGTLSWDIECYSDNHLAMPDKYNDAHVAYMISAIYKKYKINATIKRYGILIGDCHHIPEEKLSNCVLIKVSDEYEMVQAFAKVIKETDPEILVGYNILSFDYPYLDHRILRQCMNWPHMSRILNEVPVMNSTNWKSSAYGSNSINNLKISGRISIDLLPIVRRDYKFESYTLNFVCKNFLKKQKNDVSPIEMFEIYEEMQGAIKNYNAFPDEMNALHLDKAKKRTTVVMEYCIKDSELVLELMENLDVWIGLIELSNIVGVTIVEIFTKGQQVRCVSQLYDLASMKNIVINIREETTFRFAGGSVQKPIPGLYENVICLDFKSLYPSIIQAMNICYTTLIHKDHMAYIPDEDCHIIEFEQEEEETVYNYPNKINIDKDVEIDIDDESSEDENEEKVAEKVMIKKHYKFKYYKHKEGLLPLLVKNLVAERNAVRRLQKNEKNPGVWMVLEKRQLALKCSSNSVAGNTPIPCLINGTFEYRMIEELFHSNYETLEDGIQLCTGYENIKVWSDGGWADINYVGRHEAPKDMMRVLTHTGCVDVTRDHSLLDLDGNEVTVNDIEVDYQLMHVGVPLPEDTPEEPMYLNDDIMNHPLNTLEEKQAFVYGMFYAGGTCVNVPNSWCIYNGDMKLLEKCRTILNEIIKDTVFKIENDHLICDNINDWTKLFYNNRKEKTIPNFILTANYLTRLAFFVGFYIENKDINNEQIGVAGLYYLARSLGYKVNVELSKDNDIVHLVCTNFYNGPPKSIKSIIKLQHKTKDSNIKYVYDIETSTHHFAAGVGDMIVHNSFFGFLGVREGGKMPCMEAAMSITAKGRSLIKEVETYLHDKYGSKIVYGDSVTHDTPILCRQNNIIKYLTIDQMGSNWTSYGDKESSEYDYEAWTEKGWTKIHKVIRHYTNKDIYHIETESGSVNVTSDHSLLDEHAEKIKPTEVNIGKLLLHADLPKEPLTLTNNENLKEAEKNYYDSKIGNKITKITNLGSTKEYVYDLETENHHFSAGIGRLIVHNTDSVMVDLKITDSKQCQYWGEKLSQEISGVKKGMLLPGFSHLSKEEIQPHHLHTEDIKGLFLSPLEMEFEKAMRLFCIKPKKYAAYLVDDDGEFAHKISKDENGETIDELEMLIRGIVLARRDNNMFLRVLYKNILNIIMSKGKFKDAILLLIDTILDLLADKIHPKDLKSTRELGAHYKQPSFFMKVFADELRKKNKIVNPGDRLEFVVIENKEATLAGQRMVLMSDYIDSLKTDTPYKLDYIHYIEKVLVNPIDQLFEIGFTDYLNKLSYIQYKPANKRNPITLKNPTEMIMFMIKNNCDIKEFRKALIFHIDRVDNPSLSKFELNVKN